MVKEAENAESRWRNKNNPNCLTVTMLMGAEILPGAGLDQLSFGLTNKDIIFPDHEMLLTDKDKSHGENESEVKNQCLFLTTNL